MLPIDRFRAAQRFPALDGLRAIAVLAVVGFHAHVAGDRLFTNGAFGVDLFFALSGFLITTLLLRERRQTGEISLPAFYVRRTARIFPAYYAVLLLYVLVTWVMEPASPEGKAFFANLPIYATYLNNWLIHERADGGRVIFLFAWSLAVEEQFYLVWPTVLKQVRTRALVIAIACAAALSHRYFSGIGLGCLLALLLDDERYGPPIARFFSHPAVLPVSLLAVATVIVFGGHWPIALQALVAATTVGAAAMGSSPALQRVLSARPITYIGSVSYGIYLLHMLALHVAAMVLPSGGYTRAALGAVVAIGAASVSFYLYERPIQKWARSRYSIRLARRQAARTVVGDAPGIVVPQ